LGAKGISLKYLKDSELTSFICKQFFAPGFEYEGMKYVYILRSLSCTEQHYIGITANLKKRLVYHNSGKCIHTSKFMPWEIIHVEHFEKDAEAFRRERQIKGWTRVKKEALIRGDVDNLKKLSKRRTF